MTRSGAGVLSLFSFNAHEELTPGSSKPATNGCLELEFQTVWRCGGIALITMCCLLLGTVGVTSR